tara:strand:- start:90 stop:1919 length:1830 start_codon:yes stop_codon:yes gene_type:complete
MSYTDPYQYVDTTSAKHLAQLQATIAGSVAQVGGAYASHQKEIRAENKKNKEKNDITLKRIQANASKLRTNLGIIDNENPEVDFGKTYNPLINEYEELAKAVDFGTSEDPSADRKRMDEIITSVGSIKGTLENLASYTGNYEELLNKMDKQGGLYSGSNAEVVKGLGILTNRLGGTKKPVFVDGNMNKFVWEIYDENGEFVTQFSQLQLTKLSQNNGEMLTTIGDSTIDEKEIQTSGTSTIYDHPEHTKNQDGGFEFTNKIKDKWVNTNKLTRQDLLDKKAGTYINLGEVDKDAIMQDMEFSAELQAVTAGMLEEDPSGNGAIGYMNTQLNKVRFIADDFINNQMFLKGDGSFMYTDASMLPDKIKDAIKESETLKDCSGNQTDNCYDGYQFDLNDPIDEGEKSIFDIAYKKNYIYNKLPKYQQVGGVEQASDISTTDQLVSASGDMLDTIYSFEDDATTSDYFVNKDWGGKNISDATFDGNTITLTLDVGSTTVTDPKTNEKYRQVSTDTKTFNLDNEQQMNTLINEMLSAQGYTPTVKQKMKVKLKKQLKNKVAEQKNKRKEVKENNEFNFNPSEDRVNFSKYMEVNRGNNKRMNFMQWKANDRPIK